MANNGELLDDSSVHSCIAALSLESSEKCCDSNSTSKRIAMFYVNIYVFLSHNWTFDAYKIQ